MISALDLAKEQKLNFGDEIAYQLRLAKKKRWNLLEEKRLREEIELQTSLLNLIERDKQVQLSQLENNQLDEEQADMIRQKVTAKTDKDMSDVCDMFAALDMRRKVRT